MEFAITQSSNAAIVARQPAIILSTTFQSPLNRAGGRTSIVQQKNHMQRMLSMKTMLAVVLTVLMCTAVAWICHRYDSKSNGLKDANEPELAMWGLELLVVDDATGKPIRSIGVSLKASAESLSEHFRRNDSFLKTSSMIIAAEEGIVFATWIGLASSPGQVLITADGYEPMLVDPTMAENRRNRFACGDLKAIARTIRMKKAQAGAGQPATKPADKAPAEVQPPTPTPEDAPR